MPYTMGAFDKQSSIRFKPILLFESDFNILRKSSHCCSKKKKIISFNQLSLHQLSEHCIFFSSEKKQNTAYDLLFYGSSQSNVTSSTWAAETPIHTQNSKLTNIFFLKETITVSIQLFHLTNPHRFLFSSIFHSLWFIHLSQNLQKEKRKNFSFL